MFSRSRRVLAAFALLLAAACGPQSPVETAPFHATDVTGADFGRQLRLTDFNGRTRTLADFRGKVLAVFFGYTHCPDVCPTALAQLAQTRKLLGADADRLQVLFVTVDPERDTPAVLKQYVPAFDPSFLGLYGTPDETALAAADLKVYYQKHGDPGAYDMDHTAAVYVFDPQGRPRLLATGGVSPAQLAADIKRLL